MVFFSMYEFFFNVEKWMQKCNRTTKKVGEATWGYNIEYSMREVGGQSQIIFLTETLQKLTKSQFLAGSFD